VTSLEVGHSRNRGLISGRGSVFFLYPKRCNRLRSPPNNLINVYRCKTVWKWNWPQPLLVTRFRKCLVYRHPSLYLHDMHRHTFYFIWTVCIASRVNWSDISSVDEKLLYFCRQSNGCYWLPDYRVTRENVYYSRIRTCMCLPQSWASKHSTQVAPPAFQGRFGVCTIDHFWPHSGESVRWKINCIVERDVSNEL